MKLNKEKKGGRHIVGRLLITALILLSPLSGTQTSLAEDSLTVIIEGVTEDDMISDAGRFYLTSQTVVRNPKGEVSDLHFITLPCRATVTFETVAVNHRNALTVDVIKTVRHKFAVDPNLPE